MLWMRLATRGQRLHPRSGRRFNVEVREDRVQLRVNVSLLLQCAVCSVAASARADARGAGPGSVFSRPSVLCAVGARAKCLCYLCNKPRRNFLNLRVRKICGVGLRNRARCCLQPLWRDASLHQLRPSHIPTSSSLDLYRRVNFCLLLRVDCVQPYATETPR